ncbi:hypothetical protein B0I33_113124 [Prauserella shujinwangii]|uniref:Uncharacterized protein n=1 Tax=Prauserella shujinwangii TaxID=1453103 RepID=A0A2T0LLT7_9PSEU|nr:hypothetical protein [Prauserella shujinwangii]PRX43958.1 hypothetical protein B0I33_113124 [Prauserella shujinwangii]
MGRAKRTTAVLTAAAAMLGGLLAPGVANAEEGPTIRQLLEQCEQGRTDLCEFHPAGPPEVYRGSYELAGGARNCSAGTSTRVIRWESSQTTTNSVGVTISAGATLGEIFETSYEVSFSQEWSWTTTKADEIRHELGPYQAVDIFAAPMRQKVRGTYEMHFGDPYYGHYYWYVHDVVVDGPASQPAWDVKVEETDPRC